MVLFLSVESNAMLEHGLAENDKDNYFAILYGGVSNIQTNDWGFEYTERFLGNRIY